MKSSTVMMNDSHKKSKVNEPDMSMHKHPIRDESYSGESDSCCSEEFNKFFHHPVDKEFMNFNEDSIQN